MNVFAALSTVITASGGEGGEEMPSVLAVPIDELVIGIIAFLVVFGVLGKLALPKIKETLEERTHTIEGGIKRAEEAQAEAQRSLDEYRARIDKLTEAVHGAPRAEGFDEILMPGEREFRLEKKHRRMGVVLAQGKTAGDARNIATMAASLIKVR